MSKFHNPGPIDTGDLKNIENDRRQFKYVGIECVLRIYGLYF